LRAEVVGYDKKQLQERGPRWNKKRKPKTTEETKRRRVGKSNPALVQARKWVNVIKERKGI